MPLSSVVAAQRPPGRVSAPSAPSQLPGRFEVSAGGSWLGGADFGERTADLRGTVADRPFRVFTTDTRLSRAVAFEGRLGYRLLPRVTVEGRASLGRPTQRTTVTGDVENAASATVAERLSHYALDAGVVTPLPGARLGSVVPFVTAGAGVLRQIHEGRVLVETGPTYYVGGGLRHTWRTRPSGFVNIVGVRADARLDVLAGAPMNDATRRRPSVGLSLYAGF
jgi:hypothetical protein